MRKNCITNTEILTIYAFVEMVNRYFARSNFLTHVYVYLILLSFIIVKTLSSIRRSIFEIPVAQSNILLRILSTIHRITQINRKITADNIPKFNRSTKDALLM